MHSWSLHIYDDQVENIVKYIIYSNKTNREIMVQSFWEI
jgi:hypothetical protein